MHINNNKGIKSEHFLLRKLLSNQDNRVNELLLKELMVFLETNSLFLNESLLDI